MNALLDDALEQATLHWRERVESLRASTARGAGEGVVRLGRAELDGEAAVAAITAAEDLVRDPRRAAAVLSASPDLLLDDVPDNNDADREPSATLLDAAARVVGRRLAAMMQPVVADALDREFAGYMAQDAGRAMAMAGAMLSTVMEEVESMHDGRSVSTWRECNLARSGLDAAIDSGLEAAGAMAHAADMLHLVAARGYPCSEGQVRRIVEAAAWIEENPDSVDLATRVSLDSPVDALSAPAGTATSW